MPDCSWSYRIKPAGHFNLIMDNTGCYHTAIFPGNRTWFCSGLLAGMERKQIVTIAIEIASQNSGLSSGLAKTHFPSLASATVLGALYSMWQNFAGAILAHVFKKYYI